MKKKKTVKCPSKNKSLKLIWIKVLIPTIFIKSNPMFYTIYGGHYFSNSHSMYFHLFITSLYRSFHCLRQGPPCPGFKWPVYTQGIHSKWCMHVIQLYFLSFYLNIILTVYCCWVKSLESSFQIWWSSFQSHRRH